LIESTNFGTIARGGSPPGRAIALSPAPVLGPTNRLQFRSISRIIEMRSQVYVYGKTLWRLVIPMVDAYCMKCKKKVEVKNPSKIKMKNGRPATKGTCNKCGTKVFKIGA
jgi:hypothetical protein